MLEGASALPGLGGPCSPSLARRGVRSVVCVLASLGFLVACLVALRALLRFLVARNQNHDRSGSLLRASGGGGAAVHPLRVPISNRCRRSSSSVHGFPSEAMYPAIDSSQQLESMPEELVSGRESGATTGRLSSASAPDSGGRFTLQRRLKKLRARWCCVRREWQVAMLRWRVGSIMPLRASFCRRGQ